MDTYAGRLLADRYRLPRTPSEAFELVESRAFDTASGQEVLVRQVPLPEVVDAEVLDEDGNRSGSGGTRRGVGDRATRSPEDPVVRRALEAAAAAGQLPDHPRLDQVFDVFVQGDGLWIVSELVPARPLAAVLAEARLGPYRAAEVAADLLAALRIVHAHGWTHRNLTTRTVLICDDGRALLTGLASGAAEEVLCGYDPLPAPPAQGRQSLPAAGVAGGGAVAGVVEEAGRGGQDIAPWGVPGQGAAPAAPAAGAPWNSDSGAAVADRYQRWGTAADGGGQQLAPGGQGPQGAENWHAPHGGDGQGGPGGQDGSGGHGPVGWTGAPEGHPGAGDGPWNGRPGAPAETVPPGDRGPVNGAQTHPGAPEAHGGHPSGPVAPVGAEDWHGAGDAAHGPGAPGGAEDRQGLDGPQGGWSAGPQGTGAYPPQGAAPTGARNWHGPQDGDPGAAATGGPDAQGAWETQELPGAHAAEGPADGGYGYGYGYGGPDHPHEVNGAAPGQHGSEARDGHAPPDPAPRGQGPADSGQIRPAQPGDAPGERGGTGGPPPAAGGHGPLGATQDRWDADAETGTSDRYRRWGGGEPPTAQGFPAAWDFEGGGGAGARLSAEERAARSGAIAAYRAGTRAGAHAAGTAGGSGGPAELPAPGRESRAVRTGWDPVPQPRAAIETSATPRYRGPDTALAAERARQARITTVGAVTERWAPEQAGPVHDHWQLAPPVGPPADFWALGALLFRAVQGHPPYPEENPAELVQAVCAEPPAFAEECGALRPIVESLLRQDPTERPSAEELRGWLRSLLRSAPEPEVGRRTVTTPLPALEPGRPSDPRRLPIVRRRGDLVGPRRRGGRGNGNHPRRLGKVLLTLTLLGLAGSIGYIMLFLAEDPQDRAGQPPSPAPTAPTSPEPTPEPTPAPSSPDPETEPSPDGQGSGGIPQGYGPQEDPAGFSMTLPDGWQRSTTADGSVVFSDGDVEIVVVPGRDGTAQFAQGPMNYQMEHQQELSGFRADTYGTSSGLRETRVGASVMAQGDFRWRADGTQWVALNQVMQLADSYHVVLVRGPVAADDQVAEVFDVVADSYRY
ncbi:hypothetical protein SUDANB171_02190 [Streptomyces sp. enrichment culture]|uniref:protein kinase n=1 Tax=Streptomyces sp. enrichment culture TaxID=1795815 RepID=UPI003F56CB37